MTIDTSAKWWVGSEPTDIGEYLEAYGADNAEVHDFRLAAASAVPSRFSSMPTMTRVWRDERARSADPSILSATVRNFGTNPSRNDGRAPSAAPKLQTSASGFPSTRNVTAFAGCMLAYDARPVAFWDASPAGKLARLIAWIYWTKSSFEVPIERRSGSRRDGPGSAGHRRGADAVGDLHRTLALQQFARL